ncbi:unnamed protein product [Nippostrongylus brasiliensis]|uniref:Ovule protein n=1 Tax=Nippostrongylus brasiliensis TaxID=27835 RepID=A0A0N4XSL7_NIPBR|nr:unnamed protein product [Nippostrongylus brasiliensis]
MSFKRVGHDRRSELHLRYGTMGKETVCTENLTPWKKFLPCKQNGVNNWKLQLFVYNVFDVPVKTAQLGLLNLL